jgi:hypothetical protein
VRPGHDTRGAAWREQMNELPLFQRRAQTSKRRDGPLSGAVAPPAEELM